MRRPLRFSSRDVDKPLAMHDAHALVMIHPIESSSLSITITR